MNDKRDIIMNDELSMVNEKNNSQFTTHHSLLKKGYKQTEVGVIPEDWEVDEIQNLAEITTGAKNTQDKIDGGEYPFFVRSQTIERINTFSFDGEAVLTAGDGVGTGKVFHYINGKFDYHQRVYKISNFSERLNGYFFYKYFSNNFYNRIMQMTAKSSVDSVRRDMIAEMLIPLPPTLAEQTAIATALSDMDALIEGLEKLIAKKQNIKKGAMQELLAPKDGWEVKTVAQIGKPYGGLSGKSKNDFENGTKPYIPFMNVMSNPIIDISYFDYVKINSDENQNKAQKGDLFFNTSSETPEEVGMCSVLLNDVSELYLNSFCFGFRFHNETKDDGLFLSYFFRSSYGRKKLFLLAQGATRYNLSKNNFLKLELELPKPKEQTRIAQILSDMDSEIEKLETQLSKNKMIKTGMMQELLTGKKRLLNEAERRLIK